MDARYFDPIGRECDYSAWSEWVTDRPDLKVVRHYKNDKLEIKLVWNDRPIDTFGKLDVFKIEAIREIDGRRSFDASLSELSARTLGEAIALYQEVLVKLECATKMPDGSVHELDNQAEPTTHELEFSAEDLIEEEAIAETEIELDEPKLTVAVREVEVPKIAKVGTGFTTLDDGADAW
jgi:hypothetical protein